MNSLEAARQALANNDPAGCVRHSQEELARNPQNAEAIWLSAIGSLQSGQPVQARLAGKRLLELMPADADTAELWLLVAIACTQLTIRKVPGKRSHNYWRSSPTVRWPNHRLRD